MKFLKIALLAFAFVATPAAAEEQKLVEGFEIPLGCAGLPYDIDGGKITAFMVLNHKTGAAIAKYERGDQYMLVHRESCKDRWHQEAPDGSTHRVKDPNAHTL